MPPLCDSCCDHVDKLNRQVSIMRKEIKNLRQMLENATRSNRKQMTCLLSAGAVVAQGSLVHDPPPCQQSSSAETEMSTGVSLERGTIQTAPIGYIRSCFSAKNGTPRQPTVCGFSRASLCIQSSMFNNPEHALMGLQQFSHVWVIFLFHKNGHLSYRAKVKPPRLDGQRVGLYSTRTPHRPNALGLTLARVDSISGDTIHLSGVDMIDGTPVLDIKPYIAAYDSPLVRRQTDLPPPAAPPPHPVLGTTSSFTVDSGRPAPGGDPSSGRAEVTKVTSANGSPKPTSRHKAIASRSEDLSEASGSPGVGGDAALPSAQEPVDGPAQVKACVDKTALNTDQEVSRSEPAQSPPGSPGLCYGEEAHSSIAAWITAPPVGSLEVRFTPHALRELAEFHPPQHSDPLGGPGPRFNFLRGQQEAEAAIRAVLAADPRSVYRRTRCEDRLFFFCLDTAHVTCWFGPGFAEVLRVLPAPDHRTQALDI